MARLVQRDGGDDLRRSSLSTGPAFVDLGHRQSQRDQEIEREVRITLMYMRGYRVGMKFDTSEKGLLTLFKPYQAALMEYIWEINNPERTGITSGQANEYLKDHPESKSRAALIFFLNEMVEKGILEYEAKSGKGGYHKVYYPKMNREQFAHHVVEMITRKLVEIFPSAQV